MQIYFRTRTKTSTKFPPSFTNRATNRRRLCSTNKSKCNPKFGSNLNRFLPARFLQSIQVSSSSSSSISNPKLIIFHLWIKVNNQLFINFWILFLGFILGYFNCLFFLHFQIYFIKFLNPKPIFVKINTAAMLFSSIWKLLLSNSNKRYL